MLPTPGLTAGTPNPKPPLGPKVQASHPAEGLSKSQENTGKKHSSFASLEH